MRDVGRRCPVRWGGVASNSSTVSAPTPLGIGGTEPVNESDAPRPGHWAAAAGLVAAIPADADQVWDCTTGGGRAIERPPYTDAADHAPRAMPSGCVAIGPIGGPT